MWIRWNGRSWYVKDVGEMKNFLGCIQDNAMWEIEMYAVRPWTEYD